MLGQKEWQEWELDHFRLTYNQEGRERQKEMDKPGTRTIWFKLSCDHFFIVKTAKNVLLITLVSANPPLMSDE